MTWLKLDDGFHRHEKVAPLSDRAWRLHVTVMLECSAKLSDGKLARKLLDTLPRAPHGRALKATIAELIEAGLWEEDGKHVVIHDFLDWNPSAAEVEQLRSKRAAAGRAGGRQSRSRRQAKPKQVLEQTGSKPEAKPNPVPVPVPVPVEGAEAPPAAAPRTLGLDGAGKPLPRKPEFPEMVLRERYEPSPEMLNWARTIGLDDQELEGVSRDVRNKFGLRPNTWDFWDDRWMRFAEAAARPRGNRAQQAQELTLDGVEIQA